VIYALSLTGLLITAALLWVAVIAVRFLRAGRKAFERYLDMTSDPIRPATPVPARSSWRGVDVTVNPGRPR
jgi:hypothetical protein